MIEDALAFATKAHHGQKRKFTFEDYIQHPIRVAETVAFLGGTEAMIAASLLHDTVEDTEVTVREIEERFGLAVGGYVADLTCISKKYPELSRADRKFLDRQQASKIGPSTQTIRLADILDNVPSIIKYNPEFAKIYVPEKIAMMPHLKDGHPGLYAQASELLGM